MSLRFVTEEVLSRALALSTYKTRDFCLRNDLYIAGNSDHLIDFDKLAKDFINTSVKIKSEDIHSLEQLWVPEWAPLRRVVDAGPFRVEGLVLTTRREFQLALAKGAYATKLHSPQIFYDLNQFRRPYNWATPEERRFRERTNRLWEHREDKLGGSVYALAKEWTDYLLEARLAFARALGKVDHLEFLDKHLALQKRVEQAPWEDPKVQALMFREGFDAPGTVF